VYKGKPPSFQTYPVKGQKSNFEVGFGGGARYVPENEKMWDVIASYSPIAFLFLGDNVYIDSRFSRPARVNVDDSTIIILSMKPGHL